MKKLEELIFYRENPFKSFKDKLLILVRSLACLASVAFLICLIVKNGFILSSSDITLINKVYDSVWVIFIVEFLMNVILDFVNTFKRYRLLAWITNLILLTTLVPVYASPPEYGELLQIGWDVLASPWFKVCLLLLLSLQKLSAVLVGFLGKHTNPSQILAISFLAIILIGSVLLILPRCTLDGVTLSWVDSLFVSTSAVCVTGLVPIDVSTTFTPTGFLVIILLIQIGGVGVMTLTSFFALFFMGNTSIYNQLAVRDMLSSKSLNSLLSTMWYILLFTLAIEALGTFSIWMTVHDTLGMTVNEELAFAAFHSISAFCNAGFSTMSGNLGNEMLMNSHVMLYVFVSLLVILGGIGFPILVNLKDTFVYHLKKAWCFMRGREFSKNRHHIYDLNTKLVLVVSAVLLVGGTLVILIAEWDGSFAGMTVPQKLSHAFFNAACPRTAGFSSVNLTTLTTQSLLIYTFLMWIGGSSQSTAGGIKVNAFSVAVLNLLSVLRGKTKVEIGGRQVSQDSISRSNATVMLSFIVLFTAVFLLTIFEPEIPVSSLIFESVSALSTVGSSLDVTPILGTPAKMVIMLLMFTGRVGSLTLMLGFIRKKKDSHYKYPSGTIIIN